MVIGPEPFMIVLIENIYTPQNNPYDPSRAFETLMTHGATHDPLKCSNLFVMLRITPTDIALRQDLHILLYGPLIPPLCS